MVYVQGGSVVHQQSWTDPRKYVELLRSLLQGIVFFFVTIISPTAAGQFIDARRKKDDGRAPHYLAAVSKLCIAQRFPQCVSHGAHQLHHNARRRR